MRTNARFGVLTALFALVFLAPALTAQVTTHVLQIGGPNTKGLQGGDPPTLGDGSNATGTITYTFDSSTGDLSLEVENTTPQTAGEENPVITEIYFNVPNGAVTAISLTGQSAAGAVQPDFSPVLDLDILTLPNPNHVGGFGVFNGCLGATLGVKGGIANANATSWGVATTNLVVGPATFTFAVQADNMGSLTAEDFALVPSVIHPLGQVVTAALKFQSGGVGGAGSGFIGTKKGCVPSLWYTGEPCLGNTITFYAGTDVGCHSCVTGALNAIPFTFPFGLQLPASPPYFILSSFLGAQQSIHSVPVTIPQDTNLLGITVTIVNVTLSPLGMIEVSQPLYIVVCP